MSHTHNREPPFAHPVFILSTAGRWPLSLRCCPARGPGDPEGTGDGVRAQLSRGGQRPHPGTWCSFLGTPDLWVQSGTGCRPSSSRCGQGSGSREGCAVRGREWGARRVGREVPAPESHRRPFPGGNLENPSAHSGECPFTQQLVSLDFRSRKLPRK